MPMVLDKITGITRESAKHKNDFEKKKIEFNLILFSYRNQIQKNEMEK